MSISHYNIKIYPSLFCASGSVTSCPSSFGGDGGSVVTGISVTGAVGATVGGVVGAGGLVGATVDGGSVGVVVIISGASAPIAPIIAQPSHLLGRLSDL